MTISIYDILSLHCIL